MNSNEKAENAIVLLMRLGMAVVFLYASSHQVFNPDFSVAGFLGTATTFHGFMAFFASGPMEPLVSFLVAYGHLLIGLSLLVGLCTRISAFFGIILMLLYWMAHVNFPIIDGLYFIIDYHVMMALCLAMVIVKRAGHIYGLDAYAANLEPVKDNKALSWAVA